MLSVEEMRSSVEERYLGFSPNTYSVKPAHIANGLLRGIFRETFPTKMLSAFVLAQTTKGIVPKGHEIENVHKILLAEDRIAQHIKQESIAAFRGLLYKVVAADGAVYVGKMESYSAGYRGFIARDRIAQDGGGLVGRWLEEVKNPLAKVIRESAQDSNDAISLLCAPLLSVEQGESDDLVMGIDPVKVISKGGPKNINTMWEQVNLAGATLAQHLERHHNKLFRLRMAVIFAAFVILRHMACLEARYVPDAPKTVHPFLLSFAENRRSPAARASMMTYTSVAQSIARFYAWAFGRYLEDRFGKLGSLRKELPDYKGKTKNEKKANEVKEMWQIALDLAKKSSSDPFTVCGQAIYDLMAMDAEANPISYLRQLGIRSGFFYPPVNRQPAKQFRLGQDTIEMLIRSTISPGETVGLEEIQVRLWNRFGFIIGGRAEDDNILMASGIFEADSDSLEDNRKQFGVALGALSFANKLADGILQVSVEGVNVT